MACGTGASSCTANYNGAVGIKLKADPYKSKEGFTWVYFLGLTQILIA